MRESAVTHVTFEELERDECFALLAANAVGRLAVGRDGLAPLVRPVNYLLEGEVIVFRTAPGSKLDAARTRPVAFEVDGIDYLRREGWSVIVEGHAYEATHWEFDHLELEPWAPGVKDHWVRIVAGEVSGRRIRWTNTDLTGYF